MALLFPRTSVYVIDTDTMFTATLVDEVSGLHEAAVELPANRTNTDIEYVCELYTNEMSTGITASVLVKASENPDDYFKPIEVIPDSNVIDHEGGTVSTIVRFYVDNVFVAVSGITNTLSTATPEIDNILTGTVNPNIATNTNIVWSVDVTDDGTTGAVVTGNVLRVENSGSLVLRATIVDGQEDGDYVQLINMASVGFEAVTGITGIPDLASFEGDVSLAAVMNEFDLSTASVEPANASAKTITWEITDSGDSNAEIVNDKILRVTDSQHTVVSLTATVKDGEAIGSDYTQDFQVVIHVPVTSVSGIDSLIPAMTYTFDPVIAPTTVDYSDVVTYEVQGTSTAGAVITDNVINCTGYGTAIVKMVIDSGSGVNTPFEKQFEMQFYSQIEDITLTGNTAEGTIAVGTVSLEGEASPSTANQEITWEILDPGDTGATLEGDQITTTGTGTVTVQATIIEYEDDE